MAVFCCGEMGSAWAFARPDRAITGEKAGCLASRPGGDAGSARAAKGGCIVPRRRVLCDLEGLVGMAPFEIVIFVT